VLTPDQRGAHKAPRTTSSCSPRGKLSSPRWDPVSRDSMRCCSRQPCHSPRIAALQSDAEFFRVNGLVLAQSGVINLLDGCADFHPESRGGRASDRPDVGWRRGPRSATLSLRGCRRTHRSLMTAPLSELRVVELARILAGPWIGQTLADLALMCESRSPRRRRHAPLGNRRSSVAARTSKQPIFIAATGGSARSSRTYAIPRASNSSQRSRNARTFSSRFQGRRTGEIRPRLRVTARLESTSRVLLRNGLRTGRP